MGQKENQPNKMETTGKKETKTVLKLRRSRTRRAKQKESGMWTPRGQRTRQTEKKQ